MTSLNRGMMPTAKISITMSSAAFADDIPGHGCASELGRILRKLAKDIEDGDLPPINLRDINGETVGRFFIERRITEYRR